MQVLKLHKQQGIKIALKQTSTDTRIAALEAKLRITSQPKEGDFKKMEGQMPEEPKWGSNRGNPVMTHQASGAKHKELGRLLGSSNEETNMSFVDKDAKV